MPEFFITARSFAAPFVSDESERFVYAATPQEALRQFAADYSHPCGLYAAECWTDANAYHKRQKALACWHSNELQALNAATKGKSGYSVFKDEHGLHVDDELIPVDDPRGGSLVPA